MLVLSRRQGESIVIGGDIRVTVVNISGNQVKLSIEAPRSVPVYRSEVWEAIREENRQAAEANVKLPSGDRESGLLDQTPGTLADLQAKGFLGRLVVKKPGEGQEGTEDGKTEEQGGNRPS